MARINMADLYAKGGRIRRHKFGAISEEVDGVKFASKKEAGRYGELKLLQRAGEISDLQLQPRFMLQPAFTKNGKKYRAIYYQADFIYTSKGGERIVEDVKGYKTDEFRLKEKLFEYTHPLLTLKLT